MFLCISSVLSMFLGILIETIFIEGLVDSSTLEINKSYMTMRPRH